jgi:hypothetical protein
MTNSNSHYLKSIPFAYAVELFEKAFAIFDDNLGEFVSFIYSSMGRKDEILMQPLYASKETFSYPEHMNNEVHIVQYIGNSGPEHFLQLQDWEGEIHNIQIAHPARLI